MKKVIISLLSLMIIMYSCCNNTKAQSNTQDSRIKHRGFLYEEECNGHIYVVGKCMGVNSGVYFMHSPNCKCENQE